MIPQRCPFCQSPDIVKNGHTPDGRQKFHCKACQRYSTLDRLDAQRQAKWEQVEKLHLERVSQRGIARVTGLSRSTIIAWLKKKAVSQPPPPPNLPDQPEIECDELWSFVGDKGHQVWLWLAIERTTGLIVAWVCGDRSEHSARLLWEALPRHVRHHAQFYTDGWEAYQNVFPFTRHWICPKGSGGTSRVEGRNTTLRQRISALVRRTCSFSRDLLLHTIRIQLFIDHLNAELSV